MPIGYYIQKGYYYKIGNLVRITEEINITGTGTMGAYQNRIIDIPLTV